MTRPYRPLLCVGTAFLVLGAVGCGSGVDSAAEAPPAEFATDLVPILTDSAGVQIRTWPAAAWEAVEWSVDPVPLMVADGTEGGHQPFHLIASMAFDSDSTMILGEMAMTRLRRYSIDGDFLNFIGTAGQGPGEFGAMNYLGFHHDSLVVYDSRWDRISLFDPDDQFVRMFSLEPRGRARFEGMLDGGTIVGMLSSGRDPRQWSTWDMEGGQREAVAGIPGLPAITLAVLGPSTVHGTGPTFRPYTPEPFGGPTGRTVAWVEGVDYRVDFFDPGQGLIRSERIARQPPAMTPEFEDRWRANMLANLSDRPNRAAIERAVADAEFPTQLPAMGTGRGFLGPPPILRDDRGRTWVRENPMAPTQMWMVFDGPTGLLGRLVLPASFELEAIHGDMLLGVTEDELGIQTAVAYRFRTN